MVASSNAAPIASGQVSPATTSTTTAPGAAVGGAEPGFWDSFTKQDALNDGGRILQGISEQDQAEAYQQYLDEKNQLERDKFEYQKRQEANQSAYGVTRDGQVVPLNVKEQLEAVNAQHSSRLNNFNNMNSILRDDQGYASGFGRFGKKEDEEETA
jgi:hypothetical protein